MNKRHTHASRLSRARKEEEEEGLNPFFKKGWGWIDVGVERSFGRDQREVLTNPSLLLLLVEKPRSLKKKKEIAFKKRVREQERRIEVTRAKGTITQ